MTRMKDFKCIGLVLLACLTVGINGRGVAQETNKPDWRKLHYLSEEEMLSNQRSSIYQETPPPTGDYVRFPAEFEPMQAVTIRYPLGIPVNLVKLLSERTEVYVLVTSSNQSSARNTFQNAGCDMNHIHFYNISTDSYWVRDYAPWYIFNDLEPAIVDNAYNRPRQNDNMVPVRMGQQLGLTVYGMNLQHTGGNMMEDGRGIGVSDDLVLQENNNDENNVRTKMRDYLGIDPYHITIDPQGDYIAHVDCWGKLLAPDKILIAQLPSSNSHHADYEAVAEYFANTNCCWGYPYKVYRVYEPGGNTLAPYTNSLILNHTVFVPLGSNTTHNNNALAVYREAMPGYEIIGVTGASSTPWENTDALHCRTRGVMDFDMLFVDHREVLFGEQPMQDSIAITSKFIAYSGANLKQDSLLVYYSIDNGDYQTAKMLPTGNPYEYTGYIKGYHYGSSVDYYVFGADESGHRYKQPSYGALEPHHFVIEEGVSQTSELSNGWNWWTPTVEMTLGKLETLLDDNVILINSQDDGFIRYDGQNWSGTLTELVPGEMYCILTNDETEFTLNGEAVTSMITIMPGYNWFGYTGSQSKTISLAFSDFTPTEGDTITDEDDYTATYNGTTWEGDLTILIPGHGYVYYSKATQGRTTTFE